jgi:homoserine dehydrogenase
VKDLPGVLARIAQTLATRNISIAAVQQREHQEEGAAVSLVIVTHRAREADLRETIREIDRAEVVLAPTRLIRIEAV